MNSQTTERQNAQPQTFFWYKSTVEVGLGHIRYLPIRGTFKTTNLLAKIAPKPNPKGLCIVKTVHGFKMLVDPVLDKGLERALFNYGTYEAGTLKLMNDILRDGDTFIDIGANIGLMSLHAGKILSEMVGWSHLNLYQTRIIFWSRILHSITFEMLKR